jgi:hypothetical protein
MYSCQKNGCVFRNGFGQIGYYEKSSVMIPRAKRATLIYYPIDLAGNRLPFVTLRKQIGPALWKGITSNV